MVVDFPDPLGPRKPVTAPGLTWKERSSTAVFAPKRLVRPTASIMLQPHRLTLSFGARAARPHTPVRVRRITRR